MERMADRLTVAPPLRFGFKIMGWRANCSSWPNLSAVLGMWGTEVRKILSR